MACDVTDETRSRRDAAQTSTRKLTPKQPREEGAILLPAMQEDYGPDYSFEKKRKAIDGSNSVVNTSGKRTRKGESQSETGETGETVKVEPQWPDYFIEVSVRETV